MPKYSGNPTGEGNPPGEHSDSYLTSEMGANGHFVNDSSYKSFGGLEAKGEGEVGNQPKDKSSKDLEGPKENPIP